MGLARHKITGRRKFYGHVGNKFSILRAASPAARSLRLQSGAFPISKVRQAHSLIHSTRKKAFRYNFFGRFTAACVARGRRPGARQGRSVLRTTSARRPIPRVEEKVGRNGSQRGQEIKRKTRGSASGGRPSGADSHSQRGQRKKVVRAVCKTTGCEDQCAGRLGKSDGGLSALGLPRSSYYPSSRRSASRAAARRWNPTRLGNPLIGHFAIHICAIRAIYPQRQ